MIKSFGDKETEKIWRGEYSKKLPANIQPIARRKLRMINSAQDINDLRVPPGNRLEKLKGSLRGRQRITSRFETALLPPYFVTSSVT